MNRPANGRYELPPVFSEDFIPAGPTWKQQSILSSLNADAGMTEKRPRRIFSHFDKVTGELFITLQYAEPEKEKAEINDSIRYAKRQGLLRKISIMVAAEIYGETESFWFFKRNGFVRNESRGEGDFLCLEKELKAP